jgi:hypothetical protein
LPKFAKEGLKSQKNSFDKRVFGIQSYLNILLTHICGMQLQIGHGLIAVDFQEP